MVEERRLMSRRMLLRSAGVAGTGMLAVYLVGCGDEERSEESMASASARTAAATRPPAKELKLVTGWYRGREVRYYDFGMNSPASGNTVASAPIYVFITGMDAQGNPQFVEGQHNIIDVEPGDAGYSDLWQVMMVTVDAEYEPDSVRSKDELDASGLTVTTAGMFVNCPVVPEGTTLEGGEKLVQGWHKGEEVFYPDFGANPPSALPLWVMVTGMDAQGNPKIVEGQNNIIHSVPDDAGYSAFWRVNMVTVPAGFEANSLTSADEVTVSGYPINATDMVVNCPVTIF